MFGVGSKIGYHISKEDRMRANIIIHSVTGNLLIIAKSFQEKLLEKGVDARIYRVEDSDLHVAAAESNEANEYYEDIISLPLASNEKVRKGDVIILGCPALFSLPTAEMKAFMDGAKSMIETKEMEGRLFYAFSSSMYGKEAGESCATGLQLWADALNMDIIDFPAFVHEEDKDMPTRPGIGIDKVATDLAEAIIKEAK